MTSDMIWVTIAGAAIGTYLIRLSFIYWFGKIEVPAWLESPLRYVPAAVLAALVFPAIVYQGADLALTPANFRLWAGLVGALVAWKTKNVFWTIAAGLTTFWLLQTFAV